MISIVFGAVLHLVDGTGVILVDDKPQKDARVFPDASNTGVKAGVTLSSSGPLVINTPGAVIQGVNVSGEVIVNAPNVTLLNCKITNHSYYTLLINKGITGVTVKNCDIDDLGAGGSGIAGQGTFIANNIRGCVDGIDVRGDNTIIRDNYIHDMAGPEGSHFDSIQADGKFSNLLIEHNTVVNEKGQTSAVMLDNYWGPINQVSIHDNLLIGGGYTVYIGEVAKGQAGGGRVTNVSFTNNLLVKGYYGYWNIRSELGDEPVVFGNLDQKTGSLIPGQQEQGVK
jgi:Right handed beta helix region